MEFRASVAGQSVSIVLVRGETKSSHKPMYAGGVTIPLHVDGRTYDARLSVSLVLTESKPAPAQGPTPARAQAQAQAPTPARAQAQAQESVQAPAQESVLASLQAQLTALQAQLTALASGAPVPVQAQASTPARALAQTPVGRKANGHKLECMCTTCQRVAANKLAAQVRRGLLTPEQARAELLAQFGANFRLA